MLIDWATIAPPNRDVQIELRFDEVPITTTRANSNNGNNNIRNRRNLHHKFASQIEEEEEKEKEAEDYTTINKRLSDNHDNNHRIAMIITALLRHQQFTRNAPKYLLKQHHSTTRRLRTRLRPAHTMITAPTLMLHLSLCMWLTSSLVCPLPMTTTTTTTSASTTLHYTTDEAKLTSSNIDTAADVDSVETRRLSAQVQAKYANLNYESIHAMPTDELDPLRQQLQQLNAALVYVDRVQADAWKSCMLRMIDHSVRVRSSSSSSEVAAHDDDDDDDDDDNTNVRVLRTTSGHQMLNQFIDEHPLDGRFVGEHEQPKDDDTSRGHAHGQRNWHSLERSIGRGLISAVANSGTGAAAATDRHQTTSATSTANNKKCSYTFDGWGCWNETGAGHVATINCPRFVQGFDPMLQAYKVCRADGTWWTHPDTGKPWSNYTTCVDTADLAFRQRINTIQIIGNSISVIVLVVSLIILCSFENLKCTRNTIHINLFVSFIINNTMWIMWYTVVVHDPEILSENPIECRVWHVVLQYFLISNYFWMFCEGLYLLALLVLGFINESHIVRQFYAIGWGAPIPPTLLYAYMRATDSDAEVRAFCWMEQTWQSMIITIPVAVSLVLNLTFLIIIVKVLVNKLRAQTSSAEETHQTGKAVKATFILIPLLGLHFMLTPFRPEPKSQWEAPYEILTAISTSFQGFCVACLFCLTNGEVIQVLGKRWHDFLLDHRLLNSNGTFAVPFYRAPDTRRRSSSRSSSCAPTTRQQFGATKFASINGTTISVHTTDDDDDDNNNININNTHTIANLNNRSRAVQQQQQQQQQLNGLKELDQIVSIESNTTPINSNNNNGQRNHNHAQASINDKYEHHTTGLGVIINQTTNSHSNNHLQSHLAPHNTIQQQQQQEITTQSHSNGHNNNINYNHRNTGSRDTSFST